MTRERIYLLRLVHPYVAIGLVLHCIHKEFNTGATDAFFVGNSPSQKPTSVSSIGLHTKKLHTEYRTRKIHPSWEIKGSFLDDLFGNKPDKGENGKDDENDDGLSMDAWKNELSRREESPQPQRNSVTQTSEITNPSSLSKPTIDDDTDDDASIEDQENEEEFEFDGYAMRDAILAKFGRCFDMDFRRVQALGGSAVYLNIMPFHSGNKKFRHKTEYDYLCHLQAIVDILVKYDQLDYILSQMLETNKKPRANTSPLVAVPLRLELTQDQLRDIL